MLHNKTTCRQMTSSRVFIESPIPRVCSFAGLGPLIRIPNLERLQLRKPTYNLQSEKICLRPRSRNYRNGDPIMVWSMSRNQSFLQHYRTTVMTSPLDRYHNDILNFWSKNQGHARVSSKTATVTTRPSGPVRGRLQLSLKKWEEITGDTYVLSVIKFGNLPSLRHNPALRSSLAREQETSSSPKLRGKSTAFYNG